MTKLQAQAIMSAAQKYDVKNVSADYNYAPLNEREETCCAIIGRMYDVVLAHAYACYDAYESADIAICGALRNVDNIDKNGRVAVYS